MDTLDDYQKVIALSRYARWDSEKGRRETWPETCDRSLDWLVLYIEKKFDTEIDKKLVEDIRASMKRGDVAPSMRLLQYAGPALDANKARLYNCTALNFDSVRAFDETVFLLMSGCGVGGRITPDKSKKLPDVPNNLDDDDQIIVVQDSLEGWAKAIRLLMANLWAGSIPCKDTSLIRAKGTRLKTSGGFAPGPEPFNQMWDHIIDVFQYARGRKLWPEEIYSIFTILASGVVAGGSRRSALITLFSPNDRAMVEAKKDNWWSKSPQYAYSNNSAVFDGRPKMEVFFQFWHDLFKSGSGEPGFVNERAATLHADKIDRYTKSGELKVNPCCEIYSFKSTFLCNLTGVNLHSDDLDIDIKEKIKFASILGYWQACVTDFKYIRPRWRQNAEDEMLMGVSLSGICDHPLLGKISREAAELLSDMKEYSKRVADEWAGKLGMNETAAWTTVKPSGNSAQLFGVSSGIHPAFSKFYIRRIQQNADDPLSKFLIEQGVPHEVSKYAANTVTFSFYRKAPETARTADEMTALDQLELWLQYKQNYATHTVSCTVYVRDHEWLEVGSWVYKHFDELIGVSFLPYDDHTYDQAPYEAITEEEYESHMKVAQKLNWIDFKENEDTTSLTDKAECTGPACDLKF